jgi:hypothetical protein
MASLFLSYRVATAASHVGRFYDRLAVHFGETAIFYDRGSLRPGDLWRDRLRQELHDAVAVLPIIDPGWASSFAERQDTEDMVLFELETAVQLQKTIAPLRVGGSAIPAIDKLPSTLRSILNRQFFVINETTPATYDASVATVIATLENLDGLAAFVESQVVDLLVAKKYGAAELLLLRQPNATRERARFLAYLALALLGGRSFNALHPNEREKIEALVRSAHAAAPSWELPMILLAILEIDYYAQHGLVSAEPVPASAVSTAQFEAPSRSLLTGLRISSRAIQELQLDLLSESTA